LTRVERWSVRALADRVKSMLYERTVDGTDRRNLTTTDWVFLHGQRYLIHDRDSKFSEAFRAILKSAGVDPINSRRPHPT
jgi:hypothetical protein